MFHLLGPLAQEWEFKARSFDTVKTGRMNFAGWPVYLQFFLKFSSTIRNQSKFNARSKDPELPWTWIPSYIHCTVKRVDEVVRHPHLVTQDQFTQVSKKVSGIPEENFTINIELFRQNFSNVEILRQKWIDWKVTSPGRELLSSDLHSSTLPLRHTFFLIQEHTEGYKACRGPIFLLLDVLQR